MFFKFNSLKGKERIKTSSEKIKTGALPERLFNWNGFNLI